MLLKTEGFNDQELREFRRYQRLAFDILEATASVLKVGNSEHEVARRLRKSFHQAGAHNYFHVPVALFGERSAYPGDFGPFEALSTDRCLREGDTFILDAAPVFDGYTVDVSCAFNFGNSAVFEELDRELPILRELIVRRINDGEYFQSIAWEVDNYIRERGYENCHRKHIGAVLGHLVTRANTPRLASWTFKGLAVKQVAWFLGRSRITSHYGNKTTPNWNHTSACKDVAPFGLWAVEPHLAKGKVGVKFEEILVIDSTGARWLDDDLPHHRRWAKH